MFRRRGRKASFAAAVLGVVLAATLVIAPSASASIYGTTVNKYGTWMHETPLSTRHSWVMRILVTTSRTSVSPSVTDTSGISR